jgi:hypothetical protein
MKNKPHWSFQRITHRQGICSWGSTGVHAGYGQSAQNAPFGYRLLAEYFETDIPPAGYQESRAPQSLILFFLSSLEQVQGHIFYFWSEIDEVAKVDSPGLKNRSIPFRVLQKCNFDFLQKWLLYHSELIEDSIRRKPNRFGICVESSPFDKEGKNNEES